MDLQKLVDTMSAISARERSNYHLTYGDLIDALRAAPADAKFDSRVKGIGSYRGYYVDIALFTEDVGISASDTDEDFNGDYQTEYQAWREQHTISIPELPAEAHDLADCLEKLLGNYFTGWKGGEFEITRSKALWLTNTEGNSGEQAIVGISPSLELVTKNLEDSQ